jgi:hypothetical protein
MAQAAKMAKMKENGIISGGNRNVKIIEKHGEMKRGEKKDGEKAAAAAKKWRNGGAIGVAMA